MPTWTHEDEHPGEFMCWTVNPGHYRMLGQEKRMFKLKIERKDNKTKFSKIKRPGISTVGKR
jgi:hypothetical protein